MRGEIKAKVIFVMPDSEEQSQVLSVQVEADKHGFHGYAHFDSGMYKPAEKVPIQKRKGTRGQDEYYIKVPKR